MQMIGMNSVGYFEIQSSDPGREIHFYEAVFGWKFIREHFAPIEYYRIETETINGGLLKRPVPVPAAGHGTNAYVVSMQVSNFDETAALVISNGGRVAMAKFAIPGRCWQGYFLDADDNTFGIFEVNDSGGKT